MEYTATRVIDRAILDRFALVEMEPLSEENEFTLLKGKFPSIGDKVLNNFGQSDITYNLSFKLVEKILKKFNLKICGMTTQKKFLINLGILKRAEIISKNLPFSKKADIYFRVKRLIDKNSMGELFKVMLATKKNVNFQTGFIN